MRKELMFRIVKSNSSENGEVWCISKHLLAASMRLMEVGTKALGAGKKADAEDLFEKSYELYSLFWGLNMDLIDVAGVKKIDGEILPYTPNKTIAVSNPDTTKSKMVKSEKKTITKRLGEWIRKAVNCCIE